MILPFKLRRLRHGHLRSVEHIFDEDPVARGGIVDEHVRHSSDKLAVLDDGGAAHSLHYSAGFVDKLLVLDRDRKAF